MSEYIKYIKLIHIMTIVIIIIILHGGVSRDFPSPKKHNHMLGALKGHSLLLTHSLTLRPFAR